MAIPVFQTADSGAAVAGTGTSLAVPYPSNISAGDFLLLTYGMHKAEAPNTPSGWTIIESRQSGSEVRIDTFFKIAAGTESGNLTFTTNGDTFAKIARMHRFTGADSVEANANSTASGKIIDHPDIVTTGADRLAIAFTSLNDDETATSFTGETGGDLTLDFQDTTALGSDHHISIQSADMASSGTLSGGTWSFGGASEQWLTAGFALFQAAGGADHDLLADDVESASEVSTPGVGQKHVLAADDVESASEVSTPAVTQVHALLADDVESATEVSTPTAGESHVLLADDVESASEVSTPAVTQLHALLGDDVESASEVSTPSVTQLHALTADDVESASEVSTPSVAQVHALLGDDVESASEVSTPAVGVRHNLLGDDVESAAEVSTPAVAQVHALLGDDVESASAFILRFE